MATMGSILKPQKQDSVLLIDDNEEYLGALGKAVQNAVGDSVAVRTWLPSEDEPLKKFDELVDDNTLFVATDYDLSTRLRGLFGITVVGWCQKRLIPVGDFSRKNIEDLPKEPNLFELRVPANEHEGSTYIASTVSGLRDIRQALASDPQLLVRKLSLAGVLTSILSKPHLESQFAMYMTRLGAANAALLEQLKLFVGSEQPSPDDKQRLLVYVLGHVLPNAILKYPGPILPAKALCAYVAAADTEAGSIDPIFATARYNGPFAAQGSYYWRETVDEIIDGLAEGADPSGFEMFSDYNRAAVEKALGRKLANHGCPRCGGTKGGFLCPFRQIPVCIRADCSVSASSWIPQGAQLCRIEKDFYDEWAPLLGL
jgi:hypothetical protein